jgi:hypothetical protein
MTRDVHLARSIASRYDVELPDEPEAPPAASAVEPSPVATCAPGAVDVEVPPLVMALIQGLRNAPAVMATEGA